MKHISNRRKKVLCPFGLTTIIISYTVKLLSIHYNRWFVFMKDAFSDLGGKNANMPWIYNYGLIIVGITAFIYSICLVIESVNKVESLGSAFMMIASIFVSLIGIYPLGTKPHVFIALWFFIQAYLTIATWGLGLVIRGWRRLGEFFILISIIGPLMAIFIKWPSIAFLEEFLDIIIDIWIILMLKVHLHS